MDAALTLHHPVRMIRAGKHPVCFPCGANHLCLSYVLAYPMIAILTTLYWFTRQTATGIFHTATFLQAIGLSVDVISTIAWWTSVQGPFLGLGAFLLKGWTLIPCWYMLALVWSWEFHGTRRFSGWTRTRWTHRERTSMRAGSTISSSLVLAVSLASHI